jgi:hypothetical protein
MKSGCREKLFYGIQHLENFLLIFFLGAAWRRSNPESTPWTLDCFAARRAPLAMTAARRRPAAKDHRNDRERPIMPANRSTIGAVEGAIENANKTPIHDHISHCLNRSVKAPGTARRAAMRQFKLIALIARYL